LATITWIGSHFLGLFTAGGQQFLGLLTGIGPTLIALLTCMYAVVKFIGQERVEHAIHFSSRYLLLRYTLMPVLAVLLLCNPMAYTFGKFLPEYQKPAFYDAAVSWVHPVTSFFPYANAGELFVWLGIAEGIQKLNLPIAPLAIRYFFLGILVSLIRGLVTERITVILMNRRARNAAAAGASLPAAGGN
jgi:PTS system glucitol/sorbitol-specific IIC component